MKINLDALKVLEFKLAEYAKANGAIAEHTSSNTNYNSSFMTTCLFDCKGNCKYICADGTIKRIKH